MIDIKDKNGMLANFMQLEIHDSISLGGASIKTYEYNYFLYSVAELKYHSDLNWLMSVIDKMQKLGYSLTTDPHTIQVKEYLSGKEELIIHHDLIYEKNSTTIQFYYDVVIDFVEWYIKKNFVNLQNENENV